MAFQYEPKKLYFILITVYNQFLYKFMYCSLQYIYIFFNMKNELITCLNNFFHIIILVIILCHFLNFY